MTHIAVSVRTADLLRDRPIDSFLSLRTEEHLFGVGAWTLELRRNDPAVAALSVPGAGIEIRGEGGGLMFAGPVFRRDTEVDRDTSTVTFSGPDDNHWLQDRVSYPDPLQPEPSLWAVSHDVYTGPLTTVLRSFVNRQLGLGALAERRVPQLGLDDVDPAAGPTVTMRARLIPVLEVIARECAGTPIVAWIRQQGSDLIFTARERRTQPRDRFLLSPDLGSTAWEYELAAPTVTTIIVAGQGEMVNRDIRSISVTPPAEWPRRIEHLYDQRNEDDPEGLIRNGQKHLAENGAVRSLRIDASPLDLVPRRDFDLGDLVTVGIDGLFWQEPVMSIETTYEPGDSVRLMVSIGPEQNPGPNGLLLDATRRLSRRVILMEAQ